MRYLRKFNQHLEYLTYISNANKNKPTVSYCKKEKDSHYDSEEYYQKLYFTIVPLTNGYISYNTTNTVNMTSLYYLYKGSREWIPVFTSSLSGANHFYIPVVANQKVRFKGTGTRMSGSRDTIWSYFYLLKYNNFDSENDADYELPFEVEGNIMTLISGDNIWNNREDISYRLRTFYRLFAESGVINAKNLILDSILFEDMLSYTFGYMFENCSKLVCPPKFPMNENTELSDYVFRNMFSGCSSLIIAPELPATNLGTGCYMSMFEGCTSLTTPPELPATILSDACYCDMFHDCTNLTIAPELPATALTESCYEEMFKGCTSLIEAPELLANELVDYCYRSMFEDCTNLSYVKAWFTDWNYIEDSNGESNVNNATMKWLNGVSLTGTFIMNKAASWNPEDTVTLDLYDANHETIDLVTAYKYRNYHWNETCYLESYIPLEWTIQKQAYIPKRYRENPYYYLYLTIESLEDDNSIYFYDILDAVTIEYKINNSDTWTSFTNSTTPITTLNTGDKIYFRGENESYYSSLYNYPNACFKSTKTVNVYGNINSLIYKDDFLGRRLTKSECFSELFGWAKVHILKIVSAKNLILNVYNTTNKCYRRMFFGCTTLIEPPELPAEILSKNCYEDMFFECSNLSVCPKSYGKILAENCYDSMLARTNAIPNNLGIDFTNSDLASSKGLLYLFKETKVTYEDLLTLLPFDSSKNKCYLPFCSSYCYRGMFSGCTSLVTAPELPSSNSRGAYCYTSMFYGCTNLVNGPTVLSYTYLGDYCYQEMFKDCTSLLVAPLPISTTISRISWSTYTPSVCEDMFMNCTSLTTPPSILPTSDTNYYCYRGMFDGCISLTSAPELPATTFTYGSDCYKQMFRGCVSLTQAPQLPATILKGGCYSNMFNGCTSLVTAPLLSAPTLVEGCYQEMFKGCSNLNSIKCLATDLTATNCTNDWVNEVSASGTFVKASGVTWSSGTSGIPEGWTVSEETVS